MAQRLVLHPKPKVVEGNMISPRNLSLLFGLAFLSLVPATALPQERAVGPELAPAHIAEPQGQVRGTKVARRRTATVELVEKVRGSVVNIHSERNVHNVGVSEFLSASPTQNRVNGMGTGIVVDHRGYIVTNHHVVEDVSLIRVRLANGVTQLAAVVARSKEADLALLKVDVAEPLPVMPLGTAQDLMVGEKVAAIGNAYGYEHTVSEGIVSAIKRDVTLNKEISYKSLIQTDASINPGNSGGPLLNVHGELVGVNVAIRAGAQGIGFAIPVDSMIRVVADMFRARRRNVTYDGLICRDRLEQTPDGLTRKVVVDRTETGSPAERAGLKAGDVVLAVGTVKVACGFDVERGFLDRKPGEQVAVFVNRKNKEERLQITLASTDRTNRPAASDVVWRKLGVRLAPIDADVVTRVNRQLHGGLEVTAVSEESIAARAGIRRGDILVGLHTYETLSVDNVLFVLTHPELPSMNPLSFYILRSGQVRRGWLQSVQ
jgi:serine protease Do